MSSPDWHSGIHVMPGVVSPHERPNNRAVPALPRVSAQTARRAFGGPLRVAGVCAATQYLPASDRHCSCQRVPRARPVRAAQFRQFVVLDRGRHHVQLEHVDIGRVELARRAIQAFHHPSDWNGLATPVNTGLSGQYGDRASSRSQSKPQACAYQQLVAGGAHFTWWGATYGCVKVPYTAGVHAERHSRQ